MAMAMAMAMAMVLVTAMASCSAEALAAKKTSYAVVERLFVFGDSYADTGNHRNDSAASAAEYKPWRPPYGFSLPFSSPSGRYSDAHVFTDYYARYLGVGKPIPYRRFIADAANGKHHRKSGINFAFGGSGVFPTAVFCPNVSTQIRQLQNAIQQRLVLKEAIGGSIALVTVNGNDYTQYLDNGGNVANISTVIQAVVRQIGSDIVSLHALGFKRLAITNIAPVGCLPVITQIVNYSSCVPRFNGLAEVHNSLLETKIESLLKQLPGVEFVTLDFFRAFNETLLGETSRFRPCCEGIGKAGNCGATDVNGTALYRVCEFPKQTFFWDGFHPTGAAWRRISALLFRAR